MFLSIALFPSALLAQPSLSPVHRGKYNPFKIGTSDHPVFSYDFSLFLNAHARLDSDNEYFDGSFMSTAWCFGFTSGPEFCGYTGLTFVSAAIRRKAILTIVGGLPQDSHDRFYQYEYVVIPGHEMDIIDGVKSQKIKQEFTQWNAWWQSFSKTMPSSN